MQKSVKDTKAAKTTLNTVLEDSKLGGLISRNVKIDSRRTSVRLEPEMWEALYEIADLEDCTIHDICTAVNQMREDKTSFTAALRVFLMLYYKTRAFADQRVEVIKRNLRG